MQRDPLVSVVIAVRDDVNGLAATLAALERQTLPEESFEVVVVDDGSTDGTAERFRSHRLVRLIESEHPAGSYVARNRAIEVTRAPLIAITDADCRPDPGWLDGGLDRYRTTPRQLIAGEVTIPLPVQPTIAAMVDVVHHLDQARYVATGVAVTANLFVPREAFSEVGGFDERLHSGGDFEWCRRAGAAGWPVVFAPEIKVSHPPRATAAELLAKARRVATGGRRQVHEGLVAKSRPPYLSPRTIVAPHRKTGLRRVRDYGGRPTRSRWLLVGLGQLALVQLPQAYFALLADAAAVRSRLRRPKTGH